MKAFVVSILLAILLLGCIIFNNIYINRLADRILEQLEALPAIDDNTCIPQAQAILAEWDEQVEYVRLSVGYPVVDRVSEQATMLLACAECGDLYGFQSALALLRDAIGDMRRLEVISISNIL